MNFIGIKGKTLDIYRSREKVKKGQTLKIGKNKIRVWFVFHERHQNFIELLREISQFLYKDNRLTKLLARLIDLTAEEHGSSGIDLSWNLIHKIALEKMNYFNGVIILQEIEHLSINKGQGKSFTIEILRQYCGTEKP